MAKFVVPGGDHGSLAGLDDDDHGQYLTEGRGDARYYTQAQVDGLLADVETGAGSPGKSAYELAVEGGFVGSEAEWLASLQGAQGPAGPAGGATTILGSFADPGDLPTTGQLGDGYLIDGDLWVWTGAAFENVGSIQGPPGEPGTTSWAGITDKPASFTPSSHTHPATQITDSTTVGRAVLTAANAAEARSALGAGTSSLTLGTTAGTACAGNDPRLNGKVSGDGINAVVALTQATYDALGVKNPTTLYVITDAG